DDTVTLAGGSVTINLNSGGIVTLAPFTSATSATGTYTVIAGQTANPLDTNSPLVLAGGATLRDAADNDAILTIPIGSSLKDNKNIVIDTTAPTITSVTSTAASGIYGVGASIPITLTFDETVTLAGGNATINLNDGAIVTITPFAN